MSLDLNLPGHCRWYIDHFQKNVFRKKINWVNLSSGRRIDLDHLSDDDAVIVANELYLMEQEAEKRKHGVQ